MRRPFAVALALAGPLLLSACGSPFGSCRSERIEVTLPATIERGGMPETATLFDAVAVGNVGVPAFEALRAVLTEDPSSRTAGVIWTVPAFDINPGWVALALEAPVEAGDRLPVDATYGGAGWGVFTLPGDAKIVASIRAGEFAATTVTGTVEVLGVAPLRLRLDLTARNGSEATIRVRGDASFRFVSEPSPCT